MEDKTKKLIKEIKQTQEALKLHAVQRENLNQKIQALRREIECLQNQIQASRKLEKVESEYLSQLAKQYSAEVSTDFPDQTTGWRPIFPKMRSKIYGHGASTATQASHDIEEARFCGATN